MPSVKDFDNEEEWMSACVPEVEGEDKGHDQAVAQCLSMWKERNNEEDKSIHIEKMERRFLPVTELRAIKSDDGLKFEGHAAVFNKLSEDLGGFKEKIKPGAFRSALKTSDTRALFNHDPNFVLGRTTSGTLDLSEDKKGLKTIIDPPDTQWARDLALLIERGDVNQMSFGFWIEEEKWNDKDENNIVRTIVKVKELSDVSIVTYPAYPDTSIALRNKEAWEKDKGNEPADEIEVQETTEAFIECITQSNKLTEKMLEVLSEGKPMQADPGDGSGKSIEQPEKSSEPMQGSDIWQRIDAKLKSYKIEK